MSFLKSNFNLSIFDVADSYDQSNILPKLLGSKFRELTPTQEMGEGWVVLDDLFRTDFEPENSYVVDYVTFGYRCDKKKVPNALLKKNFKEALAKAAKEGKVSKDDKKRIKEDCKAQLLTQTLASPKMIECIWDLRKDRIYFDCKSPSLIDSFMRFFQNTFGISIYLKNFGITEENRASFLEWLWVTGRKEESFGIHQDITLETDKNTFKFNGPEIENYLEEIDNLKNTKNIKKIGIILPNEDYRLSFIIENKVMAFSVKNKVKIKHESVETAIIDCVGNIETVIDILERASNFFLN